MESSPESCILPAVAIVGISAEFPSGAHSSTNLDLAAFQDLLLRGQDVYETFPHERMNIQSWKGSGLGQILTDTGAFLKDLTLFDHLEFGVSAKDAKAMAVGTRKLLEQSFLALLDSGIDYRSRNVGCYMSAVGFDISTVAEPDEFEARGSFAGAPCMIANRISYYLDLLGPSVPVDTACSSSLTATHLAVQAIRSGECEAAIVGGCQVNHRLVDWVNYSQGKVLSPDGKCKPFDASANGFGRGEGTVVIVLKLLCDAIRDGDHIYGSILGTGINASGSAAPVSAPVAEAQRDAMFRAYSRTGRLPAEVDFIELHATGTAAGDPTEANWVGETFKRDGELLVGSVKGNLGHLEITAFLASLTKVCSIFHTGVIPPNVNFREPNPAIKWAEYRLRVVTEATALSPRHQSGQALISITSSGIGGSNGHVVVEGPPRAPNRVNGVCRQTKHVPVLVVAAGLTPRSATSISEALTDAISKTPTSDMPLLSTVLGRRARQLTWRSFAVILPEQLPATVTFSSPTLVPRRKPPLVFLFSGQGPQHIHMGRQLFASYSVFRDTILSLDELYEQSVGQSLMEVTGLFDSSPVAIEMSSVWPISIVLPAIAMVQIAMVDLLRSINVVPDIVCGHSAGETAMLYACGAASKEMAFSIAIARGKAMSIAEEAGGTMASLSCNALEAQSIIDAVADGNPTGKIELACFNAPEAVTIAGLESFVTKAVGIAKERGFFATVLRTRVPVHSSVMEICGDKYRSLVHDVFEAYPGDYLPKITTYSTLTGGRWDAPFTSDYFWENARSPVRFTETVSSIFLETPNATFMEISPHPVLASYVVELGANPGSVFCPMRRSKILDKFHESQVLLDCLGKLVSRGLTVVDFVSLNEVIALGSTTIATPPYPLVRRHVPYYPDASVLASRQLNRRNGPLNGRSLKINSLTHPDLAQHIIKGEPIMPAAGYLEMIFEFGARHLWNVEFHSMMSLSSTYPVPVHVDLDGIHWVVGSHSSSRSIDGYRLHAEGYLSKDTVEAQTNASALDVHSIMSRCHKVEITEFYVSLKYFADYGPAYQRITACYKGKNEVLAQVRGKSTDLENFEQYIFHPAILDSCFHVAVHRMLTGNVDNNDYYLPSHVDNIYLYDLLISNGPPDVLYVHAIFRRWNPEHLVFDFTVVDSNGSLLCSLVGFKVSRHKSVPTVAIQRRFDVVNEAMADSRLPVSSIQATGEGTPLFTLRFEHGNEMELKRKLQEVDRNKPSVIWIFSDLNDDGAAARGFSRSLRREVPVWDIRLVMLPQEWDLAERHAAIQSLSESGIEEPEIIIGVDREILLPRVSISPAPLARTFDADSLWHLNDKKLIVQAASQTIPEGHILVSIETMSLSDASLRGFTGRVLRGDGLGLRVMGITEDYPLSNYAVVHEGRIVRIENDKVASPNVALGALAVSLGLGAATMTQPSRMKGKKILVTNASSPIGRGSRCILKALDIDHDSIDGISSVSSIIVGSYDTVISGLAQKEEIQLLRSAARPSSSIFFWNDPTYGLRAVMDRQIWAAADALHLIGHLLEVDSEEGVSPRNALELFVDVASVDVSWRLFDPLKAYLLIGGIGSLGMTIAVWMYKNGARRIVMTSRNGLKSSSLAKNDNALRMLDYLQTLPDLALRLESCDATSSNDMNNLVATVDTPIGGCMLLSVVLSDKTFFAHTRDTYAIPFGPKATAFKTLEVVMDIGKLDFFITFSSVITFGNAGQTNYTSANTLTDELTRRYSNAFSLVTPAILDSAVALDTRYSTFSKSKHLISWGVTSDELCTYIEDGLRKLADGPFWLYIPDLDWNVVHSCLGSSSLYDHLTEKVQEAGTGQPEKPPLSLTDVVLAHIDVRPEDLSPDVPLTSYGLDSLSAARLSYALRPSMPITQLQLLANLSLSDLELKLHETPQEQAIIPGSQAGTHFDWMDLNKSGETIVKLRDLDGVPLILIHGADGDIVAFRPLQERFSSPLWAIQTTPETPYQSIFATARFYFDAIKKERPDGPYRIAGFSATCLITLEFARLLEANGDHIAQLAFLDHFPMLFCSPMWTWDTATILQGRASDALIAEQTEVLCCTLRGDPTVDRHIVADGLMDAVNGKDVQPHIRRLHDTLKALADLIAAFLLDLSGAELTTLPDALAKSIQGVNAPATVYVASTGIQMALPTDKRAAWADFGIHMVKNATVVTIEGDHYGFLESASFIDNIQYGWEGR